MKVVIDTNIFISAVFKPESKPAQIVELIKQGKITLLISHDILVEFRRVLLYPASVKRHGLDQKQIKQALKEIARGAVITPGVIIVNAVNNDPTDNKFIACALEGMADYIISGDRHLRDLKTYKRIKILSPHEFLEIYQTHDQATK
jgi:hypothetical protein